jgi:hypothetical protein
LTLLSAALPVALAGCGFYFGDDDCVDQGDRAPLPQVRNPESGLCETPPDFGGGGDPCGGGVTPLPEPLPGGMTDPAPPTGGGPTPTGDGDSAGAPEAVPIDPTMSDWATCDTFCNNLGEDDCKLADGCRAAYRESSLISGAVEFIGCWATAPSGPIRGEDCTQFFSGYECSRHDDCSPVYAAGPGELWGFFTRCISETTCPGGGVPVPIGDFRDPATGKCDAVTGGCGAFDPVVPDLALCASGCEGFDETTCQQADGCRAIYVDACPACDALVLQYAACWGVPPSGPIRGVPCNGFDAQECSRHDDCVAVHSNDWSLCSMGDPTCPWTPLDFAWCQDEVAPIPACDSVTDEATCIGRLDCAPVYEGSDCTCDPSGCTCATWTFISCQQG